MSEKAVDGILASYGRRPIMQGDHHLAKRKIIYYNSDSEIPYLPIEYYVIIKTGPKGDQPEEFSEKTIQFLQDHYDPIFQKDRIVILKGRISPPSLEEFRKNRQLKKFPAEK
jgi:hypothetical protein